MLFKSAYAAFQVFVRSESVVYHPATGVEIQRIPALVAEFGEHGGTFTAENPLSGMLEEHAIIHGFFFDSEAAQQRNGWTDEERESVEKTILKIGQEQPFLVAKVEFEIPVAEKPWPTYDEMNAETVLAFAQATGLVREALAYESENKGRKTLLASLEEELEGRGEPSPQPVQAEVADITL